jgi:hypothetical protein
VSWSREPRYCAAFRGHAQSVITTGDLVVNLDAKIVEVGGQRVHLTGGIPDAELLSQGHHAHEEMFLNHLDGGMDEPELKIIDAFIASLCRSRRRFWSPNCETVGVAARARAGRYSVALEPAPGRSDCSTGTRLRPGFLRLCG